MPAKSLRCFKDVKVYECAVSKKFQVIQGFVSRTCRLKCARQVNTSFHGCYRYMKASYQRGARYMNASYQRSCRYLKAYFQEGARKVNR